MTNIPIYDKGVFGDISKTPRDLGEYGYELQAVGPQKGTSSLKSIAVNVMCQRDWKNDVLSRLTTTGFPGDNDEALWWSGIQKVNDIHPISCAAIYYPKTSILLQHFNMDVVQELSSDRKILVISTYDKDKLKMGKILYAGVATIQRGDEVIGDYVRDLRVEAIADIDGDGLHEIIVYDRRYAGDGYAVFKLKGKSLKMKWLLHESSGD